MDFRPLILPVFSLAVLATTVLPVSAMRGDGSGESEKSRTSTSRNHAQLEKLQVSRTKLASIVEELPDNQTSRAILTELSNLIQRANPNAPKLLNADEPQSLAQRNSAIRREYQKLSGRQQLDIARVLVSDYPQELSGAQKEPDDGNSRALVHVGSTSTSAAHVEPAEEVVLSAAFSGGLVLDSEASFQPAQPQVPLFRPSSARPGASQSTSSTTYARSATKTPSEEVRALLHRMGSFHPEMTITLLEVAKDMGYMLSPYEANIICRTTAFTKQDPNIPVVQENITRFLGRIAGGFHTFATRSKEALILPELVEKLRDSTVGSDIKQLSRRGARAIQVYTALYAALEAVGDVAQLFKKMTHEDFYQHAMEKDDVKAKAMVRTIENEQAHLLTFFQNLSVPQQYTFAEVYRNALNDAVRTMVPAFLREWASKHAASAQSTASRQTGFATEMDMDEEVVVASTSSAPAISDRPHAAAERRGTALARQNRPYGGLGND